MAYGIEEGAQSPQTHSYALLPDKLQEILGNTFSLSALPNENKVLYVARKVFEFLGTALIFAVLIPASPIVLGVYIFKVASVPSREYKLGGPGTVLTHAEIARHFKAIIESKRNFDFLEVWHGGSEPLKLNDESLEQMKAIQPKRFILSNIYIDDEELKKLETVKSYYVQKLSNQIEAKDVCILEQREKISLVVLPSDEDEMLKVLKRMSERGQRVVNICFSKTTPVHLEKITQTYIDILGPCTHSLLLFPRDQSPEAVAAMLKA